MLYKRLYLPILMGVAFISGCATPHLEPDAKYAPVSPPVVVNKPQNAGLIYLNANNLNLFETVKAHRVGDILTIVFDENTVGKKETKTEDNKTSAIGLANLTVFGKAVTTDPITCNATSNAGAGWADGLLRGLNTSIESSGDFKSKEPLAKLQRLDVKNTPVTE